MAGALGRPFRVWLRAAWAACCAPPPASPPPLLLACTRTRQQPSAGITAYTLKQLRRGLALVSNGAAEPQCSTHSAAAPAPCSSSHDRTCFRFRRSMADEARRSDFMRKATAPTPTARVGQAAQGRAGQPAGPVYTHPPPPSAPKRCSSRGALPLLPRHPPFPSPPVYHPAR